MGAPDDTGPLGAAPRRTAPPPLLVGVVCALAALAFVTLRVLAHDGDVTSLIRIGLETADPGAHASAGNGADVPVTADLATVDGLGYDGQFFYRQALDPLSTAPEVDGIPLDRPAYRAARIAYPAAVWLAAVGGDRTLVPFAMAGVNVVAVGLLGLFGAVLARGARRSTWWGAAFAAWAGMAVGLAYDLAEPVEAAAVAGALVAFRTRRPVSGTLALCVAALARESSLVVALGILAGALAVAVLPERLRDRLGPTTAQPPVLAALAPIAAYLGVQAWMVTRFAGTSADTLGQSGERLGSVPFVHLGRALVDGVTSGDPVDAFQTVQRLVLMLLLVALAASLVDRDAGRLHERLALAGGLTLLSLVDGWDRMVVYLRWPGIAVLVGLVVFLDTTPTTRPAWVTDRLVAGSIGVLVVSTVPVWILI